MSKGLTDVGRILLSHVQNGAVLVPTRIVMGSGYMTGGASVENMTAVVTPVLELNISKKDRYNDGKCVFGGAYFNSDITTAFYYREIALFCRAEYRDADGNVTQTVAECLYVYGNFGNNADLLPAYSTGTVVERNIDLVVYVGGTNTQVDLTVESGNFVNHEALQLLDEKKVNKSGDTMTGNLEIDKVDGSSPAVLLRRMLNGVAGRADFTVATYFGKYVPAIIFSGTNDEMLSVFYFTDDGIVFSKDTVSFYRVYDQFTKPTPEEISASRSLLAHTDYKVGPSKPFPTIQAALDAIPRNTGGWQATIYVDSGTYTEDITIANFYGGTVKIMPSNASAPPTIAGHVHIINCSATVILEQLDITAQDGGYGVAIDYAPRVYLNALNIIGTAKGSGNGVVASMMSRCVMNGCHLNKFDNAVFVTYGGTMAIYSSNIQNATVGVYANCGIAQVSAGATVADVEYVTDHGGRIYFGSQTAVPNY